MGITVTSAALDPVSRRARYERAFAGVDGPFAFVDLDAMWSNSAEMIGRSGGKPIRVASKSLRCEPLQRTILERDPAYQGFLTFTLPETLWLAAKGHGDLVCAYPSTDREALRGLAELGDEQGDVAPVLMIDSVAHLDLIESATGGAGRVNVAIEADAGFWTMGDRLKIGPKRSPIRTPEQAAAFAVEIGRRSSIELMGLMLYEGQIAGVGDEVPGNRLKSEVIKRMQRASVAELAERRGAIVAALERVQALGFVNGGGTGSLHLTSREPAVTELAAGSGFYAPTLFDPYSAFTLEPAAMFALPIVRRPSPRVATALGGGYIASGPSGRERLPSPYLPTGLKLDSFEGAGEVQTPLQGAAARDLRIGDNVYFRHTKAGELCERFNSLYLVEGDAIVDEVPTYRGEGQAFL